MTVDDLPNQQGGISFLRRGVILSTCTVFTYRRKPEILKY
jgi:hypothetical protein